MTLPPSFKSKKSRIIAQLSIPADTYDDLSPKGSIDVGIRNLIDEINSAEGWVTTSSCAGRVSVFLEGVKEKISSSDRQIGDSAEGEWEYIEERGDFNGVKDPARETTAGVGGKGGGGRWLFVSHDPVSYESKKGDLARVLGMERLKGEGTGTRDARRRFVHFKFEPMILHILAASLAHAQTILSAALQAGFRESGALNLVPSGKEPATPMVAVRSTGLALESIIGYYGEDGTIVCNVNENDLETLLEIGNLRFRANENRIKRFRELLAQSGSADEERRVGEWEDTNVRKERMRKEGLERKLLKQNRVLEMRGQLNFSELEPMESEYIT